IGPGNLQAASLIRRLKETMKYTDKTVIITGGGQGIGEGCVRVFAVAGANVVLADCDEPNGRRVAAEAGQAGPGKAVFINCDVTKTDDIRRLIDETIVRFRRLLEVNLVSVFTACKFALPHLRRTEGNIINLASLVATTGQHHATTYVATKGAVLALTKALAIDEAIHNVRVNSVSPGNIYTPLWQEAIDAAPDPAQFRADGEAAQLMGRMGTPEEAGKLCLFI